MMRPLRLHGLLRQSRNMEVADNVFLSQDILQAAI